MSLFSKDPEIKWEETLAPEQAALRDKLVRRLSNEFGTGYDMPDYVSGASPLQQAGFEHARQLQQGLPSWMSQATQQLATGQPSYTYDPAASEQFYTEGLYAPAMRDFQRDILPALAEQYAGAGLSRGGDFQSALARAGSDFATNLSAQRAGLMRQDVSDARMAAESAYNRMPTGLQLAGQEQAMPINLGMQVGGAQRGIANELGMQGLQQDIMSQWWGDPGLGFLGTALTPTRMPRIEQKTQKFAELAGLQLGIQGSVGQSLLGGGGGAGGGGGGGGGLFGGGGGGGLFGGQQQ